MTQVTVDEGLLTKLLDLTRPVEVLTSKGRVVGRFFPTLDPALYVGMECPFSPEEIARRKQNRGKTYTTEEVIAHLEKL